MKRRVAGSVVIGAMAATLAGCSTSSSDSSGGKIYIGVAGPISGSQAVFGEDMVRSARLAVAQINTQGGVLGKTVEIIEGDDQGDARQASLVAQKMISTEGLVGVVGHFNSGCSIPASQVYNRANLVMLSPGSTNPTLTEQGFKNVFRLVGRDDQQGPLSANFALNELKAKNIAIINDKTAYGQGLAEAFRKSVEAGGAKVLIFEGVNQGERDFRAVLTKIKGLKPDALFFGGVFTEAGLVITQARELGLTASFLSGDGTQVQSFIDTVGSKSDKIFVTGVRTINSADFLAEYKATYKESPTAFGTYTYDATKILLAAISAAGVADREKVTEAVRATKDFKGLGGTINFDAKGDPTQAPFDIFIIEDKKFVPFKKA